VGDLFGHTELRDIVRLLVFYFLTLLGASALALLRGQPAELDTCLPLAAMFTILSAIRETSHDDA